MINFILEIRNADGDKVYKILQDKDHTLWITDGSGEGGEFNASEFFEAIDKFYKENF